MNGKWLGRIPGLGMLAFAAFVVCVATGIMLAPVFRPEAALDSLSLLFLKNPAATFVHSLHDWSAQAFMALTLAHLLDHLIEKSEARIRTGVWVRLSLSVPVLLAAMLSGFLLRGDGAATQALHVLRSLLALVPGVGAALARMLTGSGSDLQTVYLQHASTATLILWLVTIEHARRIVPRAWAIVWVALPLAGLSALFVPWVETHESAVEKGPWYLVGLQEMVHWLAWPRVAVWLLLAGLLALAALPLLAERERRWAKRGLAAATIGYAALTVMGLAFRGADWKLESPRAVWNGASHFVSYRALLPVEAKLFDETAPLVDGRREGCLICHANMKGFVAAHDPKTVGCAACHLGNPFTLDKKLAHQAMTLTPGNLSLVDQTCGRSNCHAQVTDRVRGSLMNTMSGVVAVDRFAFGESAGLDAHDNVADLGQSPADTHLRQLCASCHLGQDKQQPEIVSELSRGGGCSACHLHYGDAAAVELAHRGAAAPLEHPEISVHVRQDSCFGCHSRSGRIPTNYEGWMETQLEESAARAQAGWPGQFRVLADGRVFKKQPDDVHHAKGMSCVDCHIAAEVMSDGKTHAHEGDAVKIACLDCHRADATPARELAQLDGETQEVAAMRKLNAPGRQFVVSPQGAAYPNVFLGPDGKVRVELIETNQQLQAKPVAAVCARKGGMHERLSCDACHAAWAPQCVECHTSFDRNEEGWDYLKGGTVRGAWDEREGNLESDAPALGVESVRGAGGKTEDRIEPFAPGMIMDLKIPAGAKNKERFLRLFAPVSPHTTASAARDCRSCHNNPAALGYGRGRLNYVVQGDSAAWEFVPQFAASQSDGLPRDAWIGFLREPSAGGATRHNARPFSLAEQRQVLLVGACLQCHTGRETRVAAAFADFNKYASYLSARCTLPAWAAEKNSQQKK